MLPMPVLTTRPDPPAASLPGKAALLSGSSAAFGLAMADAKPWDRAIETSASDEELVRSALGGNPEAFRLLVLRHKGRVFGLASRFTRDAYQLEDLAQEVFLKLWQNLGQYREDAPFTHWLSRVAVRVCYDFLRRNRRFSFFRTVPLEEVEVPQPGTDADEAARERVEAALARLKPPERLVLTLLELDGMSLEAVSQATGWSVANVKVRAFRARNALRKILSDCHE